MNRIQFNVKQKAAAKHAEALGCTTRLVDGGKTQYSHELLSDDYIDRPATSGKAGGHLIKWLKRVENSLKEKAKQDKLDAAEQGRKATDDAQAAEAGRKIELDGIEERIKQRQKDAADKRIREQEEAEEAKRVEANRQKADAETERRKEAPPVKSSPVKARPAVEVTLEQAAEFLIQHIGITLKDRYILRGMGQALSRSGVLLKDDFTRSAVRLLEDRNILYCIGKIRTGSTRFMTYQLHPQLLSAQYVITAVWSGTVSLPKQSEVSESPPVPPIADVPLSEDNFASMLMQAAGIDEDALIARLINDGAYEKLADVILAVRSKEKLVKVLKLMEHVILECLGGQNGANDS